MLRTTACWKELPTTRHPLACISQRIGRVLTFPDGSGTARKIWHGYRSPVSSPDSSQTARTKPKKRRETEHSQMAPPPMLGMYAHTCYAHRLVIVRGMQRRNLTKRTCSMLRRRVQRKSRRCSLTTTSSLFVPKTHMAYYFWLSRKKQTFEATYGSTRDVSQASRAGLGISGGL